MELEDKKLLTDEGAEIVIKEADSEGGVVLHIQPEEPLESHIEIKLNGWELADLIQKLELFQTW